MSKVCRGSLFFLLSAVALLMFSVSASAQMYCVDCDPYSNHCSDECLKCAVYGESGCESYTGSTCGATGSGGTHGHCIADNCDPSWSETSRVTQGTYDGNGWFSCTHHSVQWVTVTDANQCNVNADYRTQHYCDDVIDGSKSGTFNPSCCDGTDGNGNPSSLFTCNGYHSCTG
jgi:hypothetical protein